MLLLCCSSCNRLKKQLQRTWSPESFPWLLLLGFIISRSLQHLIIIRRLKDHTPYNWGLVGCQNPRGNSSLGPQDGPSSIVDDGQHSSGAGSRRSCCSCDLKREANLPRISCRHAPARRIKAPSPHPLQVQSSNFSGWHAWWSARSLARLVDCCNLELKNSRTTLASAPACSVVMEAIKLDNLQRKILPDLEPLLRKVVKEELDYALSDANFVPTRVETW